MFHLLLFLLFPFITGKIFDQNLIDNIRDYGEVAHAPYTIKNEGGEDVGLKIWVQININRKDPTTSLLTIVRLDNLTKNPKENLSYKRDSFHLDLLWRGTKGWDSNLYILFDTDNDSDDNDIDDSDKELVIPPFLNDDFYQIEVKTRKKLWKTFSPIKKEIPSIIHQITSNKKGKVPMDVVQKAITITQLKNPSYQHISYCFDELASIINGLEGKVVFNAFNRIQATAYKADLFRVVILYHYGGVYLDSKMIPILPFDMILPKTGSYFPFDIGKNGIQGAFLAFPPKDPMMRGAIDEIVANVKKKFYGTSSLQPTGPAMLLGEYEKLNESLKSNYKVKTILRNGVIGNWTKGKWKNMVIFHNAEYRRLATNASKCHYSHLWHWGAVYHERYCLSSFGIIPNLLDIFYFFVIVFALVGITLISFKLFKSQKKGKGNMSSISNKNTIYEEIAPEI